MIKRGTSFFDEQPMFVLDHKTSQIVDFNPAAAERYKFTREELLGRTFNELGKMKNRAELLRQFSDLDQSIEKLWIIEGDAGNPRYVQFTSHLFNYGGKPAKLAIAHDISPLLQNGTVSQNHWPQLDYKLSNSPLAEIEWDGTFKVKRWSEKAEQLFGWTEEEASGDQDFLDNFLYEDELQVARERLQHAIDSQKDNYTAEGMNYTKNGDTMYCEWYNSLLYDDDGEIVAVYSLVHDITDRKESENMFRALSEESLVGVYLIQDDVFKYVNPRFARIFHYKTGEIENKISPLDLAYSEDRQLVEENIKERLQGKTKSVEYDFRCLTKDEQVIQVHVYGTRVIYRGKPAVIGTLVDITDTKLAMERYKASVESFEDLFDSISDGIYIQNREGKFVEVNQGAVDMYGYDRDFFIGKTPEVLAAPGKVDLGKTHQLFEKALKGTSQHFEWWGKRKNGEVFPKEVILNPGTYFGEDVVIAISRDISGRFEVQEQIRKNEELFRQLFQNAPIGIAMMDEHQEIRFVNDAFEEIFGYSSEEVKGLDIDRLIVPEEGLEEAIELSSRIFRGRASQLTGQRKRKDGTLVDVLIYGVPVTVNGKTIAIFGIYADITDRKEAEEQVRRSLKEKEVLLAEIHHRVKNNLAVITGLLELQALNSSSELAKDVLYESKMRINSIALIHEKLYQSEDLSQISFDVYIKELLEIIEKSLANEQRTVAIQLDTEEVFLTINQAIPCGLILNELVTNAYKHAFEGKKEGGIDIFLKKREGTLQLRVQDDGKGLPGDVDFENPNSLGITLIKTLCKQLKGEYTYDSGEGGTAFELEFIADG